MKIALSDNGPSKEWKPLKELEVGFAKMNDGLFGKDYYILVFNEKDTIVKLLTKFNKSVELEFFFLQ